MLNFPIQVSALRDLKKTVGILTKMVDGFAFSKELVFILFALSATWLIGKTFGCGARGPRFESWSKGFLPLIYTNAVDDFGWRRSVSV